MRLERCRLTRRQRGESVGPFVAGSTARTAAPRVAAHPDTAARFFAEPPAVIAADQGRAMAEAFDGPVEIDASYLGGRRKGKRGRGAAGKVAVLGALERGGAAYARTIADRRRDTPLPIIRREAAPGGVAYADSRPGCDTPRAGGYRHERVNHDQEPAAAGGRHINGVGNFRGRAERHRRRFDGVPKGSSPLFPHEVVWRHHTGTPANPLKSPPKLLRRK